MRNTVRKRAWKRHVQNVREVRADFKGILDALVENLTPDAKIVGTTARGGFAARLAGAMQQQEELRKQAELDKFHKKQFSSTSQGYGHGQG